MAMAEDGKNVYLKLMLTGTQFSNNGDLTIRQPLEAPAPLLEHPLSASYHDKVWKYAKLHYAGRWGKSSHSSNSITPYSRRRIGCR